MSRRSSSLYADVDMELRGGQRLGGIGQYEGARDRERARFVEQPTLPPPVEFGACVRPLEGGGNAPPASHDNFEPRLG
jgi:hypothetical protein